MVRMLVAAALLLPALAANAATTRLQVTSRPDRHSTRVTYSSTDALAGLDKGPGADRATIGVQVFVRQSDTTVSWAVPAGTYAGVAGWLANDATRALFQNHAAPEGTTGVSRTLFATGRRVKLIAKNLGDAGTLALGAAPATAVDIAYVVTNGGETHTHCARFAAANCLYIPLDGGSGWKLRCDDGVADLSCGARPTCGNGIVEPGEDCDGGALCSPQCRQGTTSCCQGSGTCISAPSFSLQYYLLQYCMAVGSGSQPVPGAVCHADGTCGDEPIAPVPVCCQQASTCFQQSASSVVQLWYDQYYCNSGAGLGNGPYIIANATCGADGVCVHE